MSETNEQPNEEPQQDAPGQAYGIIHIRDELVHIIPAKKPEPEQDPPAAA